MVAVLPTLIPPKPSIAADTPPAIPPETAMFAFASPAIPPPSIPPQTAMVADAPPQTAMAADAPPQTAMVAGAPPQTAMVAAPVLIPPQAAMFAAPPLIPPLIALVAAAASQSLQADVTAIPYSPHHPFRWGLSRGPRHHHWPEPVRSRQEARPRGREHGRTPGPGRLPISSRYIWWRQLIAVVFPWRF